MRILIAEADDVSRLSFARALKQLGHEAVQARNGEEAWELVRTQDIPCVIADWGAGDIDGVELCRRIRAENRTQYTYVLLLTVVSGNGTYLPAMEAGADDFLVKPFDADQLNARLRLAERILSLQQDLAHLELTRAQVVQQERLRALGQMASGIAHDFNNALATVLGYSSLLLTRPGALDDTEKVRRSLEMIYMSGDGAAQLVRRLREFYRHRDETEVVAPTDLRELATEALSLTEPKWKAEAQAAGNTILAELAVEKVPLVEVNRAEFRDVLVNLIFNAVDAMPDGGTLTIRTGVDAADRSVFVAVADTGVGMTEEVRRRCLEPYFTTKGEHGTGLGLAMIYGIVYRHGGRIEIDSSPGKGTTLSIHLPAAAEQTAPTSSPAVQARSRPLRALVVDDEPLALQMVAECFSGDGHIVDVATNGREGLERFQLGWYDVVVTDMAMPEMNGIDLAQNVKRISPTKPVVIMLTGFAVDNKPPGVDIVLSKPVTLAKLRETLAGMG